MGRVQGKVALVTGAASGIGEGVARRLAAEGAIVLLADVNAEAGRRVEADIAGATFLRLDVSVPGDWAAAMDHVRARHGRLDILVHVAGITRVANIEEEDIDTWRRLFAVNADGSFLACHHGVRTMRASGVAGSIVLVSSPMAVRPGPAMVAYSASKGVGLTLTKSVALHCAQQQTGIRCNAVLPGSVHTGVMEEYLRQVPDREQALRDAAAMMPINRLCTADEVAASVLFLASDEAATVTGSVLAADGAYSIA